LTGRSGYVVTLGPSDFDGIVSTMGPDSAPEVFWFAWCEEEIRLPGKGGNLSAALDPRWDMVRIFTDDLELRRIRRHQGWIYLFLTEDEGRIPASTDSQAILCFPEVMEAYRVLAGDHLTVGRRTDQGLNVTAAWGVVAYPKPLEYGGFALGRGQALVAHVRLYADETGRLRWVRYCRLEVVQRPDSQSLSGSPLEVKPYEPPTPEL